MVRRLSSLLMNVLIGIAVLAAWTAMMLQVGEGSMLSARGLSSLKYFTVLSNLLEAISALTYAAYVAFHLRGRKVELPRPLMCLKYAAVASVALTFFTVMLFLGPLYGYASMFVGSNLWFHLVVPLAAMADFCILDRTGTVPMRSCALAMIPMLLYAVGYTLNILINGIGRWPNSNDWYGFVNGGVGMAAVAFVAMTTGAWCIALLLRLPRRGGAQIIEDRSA